MTDAPNGSATAEQPNAGIPSATNGAEGDNNGSQVTNSQQTNGAADPFSGLEAGTREWIGTAGIKDVSALAEKARGAEALIGRSVQIPGAEAKPEDWDKFYGKLGRPENADGYEFKLPENLPAELPYDGEFAGSFKAEAHKEGLTGKQAANLHDWFVQNQAGLFAKSQETMAADAVKATEAFEAKWGPSGSDTFKSKADYAVRALDGLGLKDAFHARGLLAKAGERDNIVIDPTIGFALAQIGEAMFKEDTLESQEGGRVSDNPFTGTNMTEQMRAIRADRPRALRMIAAAGKKPSDFGLSE